jgi:hypothetical protein
VIIKKTGLRQLILFTAGALLACLPFLIKNVIMTGAPFYPLMAAEFGVKGGLLNDAAAYVAHVSGFGSTGMLQPFLGMVMNPENFGGDMASPLMLIALLISVISFRPAFLHLFLLLS